MLKIMGKKIFTILHWKCLFILTYVVLFVVDEYVDHSQMTKGTYSKPGWFGAVKEEYRACKERVCLVDMSSFTKIEIKVRH